MQCLFILLFTARAVLDATAIDATALLTCSCALLFAPTQRRIDQQQTPRDFAQQQQAAFDQLDQRQQPATRSSSAFSSGSTEYTDGLKSAVRFDPTAANPYVGARDELLAQQRAASAEDDADRRRIAAMVGDAPPQQEEQQQSSSSSSSGGKRTTYAEKLALAKAGKGSTSASTASSGSVSSAAVQPQQQQQQQPQQSSKVQISGERLPISIDADLDAAAAAVAARRSSSTEQQQQQQQQQDEARSGEGAKSYAAQLQELIDLQQAKKAAATSATSASSSSSSSTSTATGLRPVVPRTVPSKAAAAPPVQQPAPSGKTFTLPDCYYLVALCSLSFVCMCHREKPLCAEVLDCSIVVNATESS
jgi:hypothetical protein